MSEDNVESVRAFLAAYNRRDFEAAVESFDPEIEWVLPERQSSDSCRGPDEIKQFWEGLDAIFDELRLDPQEHVDAGDRIATRLLYYLLGKGSGVEFEGELYHQVTTFRAGRIVRIEYFAQWPEALEAATERPSEVVRRHFASFGRGGLEEAAKFWHPEIEWRAIKGAADDVGVIRGEAAMRRYYEEWVDTMADLRAEVVGISYEDDERVAASIRNSGTGRVSGVPTAGRYYVACLVRNGQIVAGHEYATSEEAVASARRLG
jgi:ketosteroid isomerase-like protein